MSVVAGIFLAARDILARIEEATHSALREVEVVSRGVRNSNWESIALRTLGLPLRFHDDADMSARGAAMLALTLDGTSVEESSRRLGTTSRVVHPASSDVDAARRLLENYQSASAHSLQWRRR